MLFTTVAEFRARVDQLAQQQDNLVWDLSRLVEKVKQSSQNIAALDKARGAMSGEVWWRMHEREVRLFNEGVGKVERMRGRIEGVYGEKRGMVVEEG